MRVQWVRASWTWRTSEEGRVAASRSVLGLAGVSVWTGRVVMRFGVFMGAWGVLLCVCLVVFDWGKGGEALSWGVFVGVVFELDEKGLLLMAQGLGTA